MTFFYTMNDIIMSMYASMHHVYYNTLKRENLKIP